MQENKTYLKHFVTMLSGNTLSQLIPFLVVPFLGRIFSPEDFAVSANFLAIVGVIGIIATGRLELAIPIPKDHRKAQEIAYTGFVITCVLGILSCLIPLYAEEIGIAYGDRILSQFLWLVPIAVFSYGFLGLSNNWALRHKKFTSISLGKVAQSAVNNGLAALLGYLGWGIIGLIVGWLISQYINIFILLVHVDRKIQLKQFNVKVVKTTLKEYRDFPLINSLHAFTDIFATQFLLFWMISTYFGKFELGLFAMMHRYVRAPIVLVTSSVSQLFYVEANNAKNDHLPVKPIILRTLKTTLIFAVPFTLILLFFAPTIFKLYIGPEWEIAGEYARCLIPMFFMYFIISPISGLPIIFDKQKSAFLFSILAYTLSLGGLFIGILLGWSFYASLWLYAAGFTIYNCFILIWFFSLEKRSA